MTLQKDSAEKAIRDIRRVTRRQYSAEEKIRIVLESLRGEVRIIQPDLLGLDSFQAFEGNSPGTVSAPGFQQIQKAGFTRSVITQDDPVLALFPGPVDGR